MSPPSISRVSTNDSKFDVSHPNTNYNLKGGAGNISTDNDKRKTEGNGKKINNAPNESITCEKPTFWGKWQNWILGGLGVAVLAALCFFAMSPAPIAAIIPVLKELVPVMKVIVTNK